MKLSDVRLLVKDFDKSLKFYTEKLGFERLFNTDGYEGFKVLSDGDPYLAIFESDYQAMAVGNISKSQPTTDFREKMEIAFAVRCVDTSYNALKTKGVEFINEPFDWECAGIRCVHFRDPDGNLLSLVGNFEEDIKDDSIKFDSVGVLVSDFQKELKFYTEQLGLETSWNDDVSYASFKVAEPATGLSLFTSGMNAETIGNADKPLPPADSREKIMFSFDVECVDTVYEALKAKGVEFINEPFDWKDAYMRAVHFRDPEGNLIEIHAGLACAEECGCC
jgi:catechol 2,3-dioxygenase-like lactoylglutathione lyase family enzyme